MPGLWLLHAIRKECGDYRVETLGLVVGRTKPVKMVSTENMSSPSHKKLEAMKSLMSLEAFRRLL